MLHSERVVFVELHKAGSTRVVKLLAEVAGPDLGEKQPTYANALAGLGKPVVGYVCDPLHWYLALWKHGCAGKGDLRKRLTDPAKWGALMAKRAARAHDAGKQPAGREIPEGWGAEHARTAWYGNPESPQAFREWLKAVMMTRGIRRLVNNAYNNSPVQKIAGLMTYEYFATFVRDTEVMEKWVDSPEALVALNAKKAITQHFVRAESPGADLVKVLGEIGLPLTEEQAATARAWDEGNARQKQKQIETFYDTETRHWVQRREKALFKIFGYPLPLSEEAAPAPRPEAEAPQGDEPSAGGSEGPAKAVDPAKAEKSAEKKADRKMANKAADQAAHEAGNPGKAANQANKPAKAGKGEGADRPVKGAKAGQVGKPAKADKPQSSPKPGQAANDAGPGEAAEPVAPSAKPPEKPARPAQAAKAAGASKSAKARKIKD